MEKKISKKEMFATILKKYDFTAEETAFIEHEIELLNKKRGTSGKPTASQELAQVIKEQIAELFNDGKKYTATEVVKELQPLHEDVILTNQRISAVLNKMVKDEVVAKIKEGKKTLFYGV